jgi:hypothetical protein
MLPDRRLKKIAKVGVEGSNPFARSSFVNEIGMLARSIEVFLASQASEAVPGGTWEADVVMPPDTPVKLGIWDTS